MLDVKYTGISMFKRIFVTHHKTGHHLCNKIAKAISKELGLTQYDLSTASEVPNDADVIVYESSAVVDQSNGYRFESWGGDLEIQNLKFRGVHVIRHPYEIIASAYRWHKKIDRPWVNVEWKDTGKSYKEHLLSGDGIAFEMKNRSRGVIMNIYNFPFSDDRFLTVTLEDFEENYELTIVRIAQHLGLPEEVVIKASARFDLNTMTKYPAYVTRRQLGTSSHSTLFEPHHYELFREIFPPDIFSRFGFDK
jgi:hypothetical protein